MKNKFNFIVATAFLFAGGCSHSQPGNQPAEKTAAPQSPAATSSQPSRATNEIKPSAKEEVLCHSGGDVRKLNLLLQGSGCVLQYTKNGMQSNVAKSKHGKHHCENTLEKIEKHLKEAGFYCGS